MAVNYSRCLGPTIKFYQVQNTGCFTSDLLSDIDVRIKFLPYVA